MACSSIGGGAEAPPFRPCIVAGSHGQCYCPWAIPLVLNPHSSLPSHRERGKPAVENALTAATNSGNAAALEVQDRRPGGSLPYGSARLALGKGTVLIEGLAPEGIVQGVGALAPTSSARTRQGL